MRFSFYKLQTACGTQTTQVLFVMQGAALPAWDCILKSFKLNCNHCFVMNLLALYSREDKHPMTVKFTNKTGKKIQLFWINKKGRRKRKGKLKDGQSKTIDTYETHVFMAVNKKLSREPLLINGSPVFNAFPHKHGGNHLEVEIKKPTGMMHTATCFTMMYTYS